MHHDAPDRRRRAGSDLRDHELDPPTSWAVHGIDGPIRAIVNLTVEPVNGSTRSHVTIELDFEGHGIGKVLVPLVVRRQTRNEMSANCRKLKQRLEGRKWATRFDYKWCNGLGVYRGTGTVRPTTASAVLAVRM
jgi:hypothetical protein